MTTDQHNDAVQVRQLELTDRLVYQRFLQAIELADIRSRILGGAVKVEAAPIDDLLTVNGKYGTAYGALLHTGELLGVARLAPTRAKPSEFEFAILVRTDHKRRGIGRALMQFIIEQAKQQGYCLLVAETLRVNVALRSLAGSFGFQASTGDDVDLVHLTLNLS